MSVITQIIALTWFTLYLSQQGDPLNSSPLLVCTNLCDPQANTAHTVSSAWMAQGLSVVMCRCFYLWFELKQLKKPVVILVDYVKEDVSSSEVDFNLTNIHFLITYSSLQMSLFRSHLS